MQYACRVLRNRISLLSKIIKGGTCMGIPRMNQSETSRLPSWLEEKESMLSCKWRVKAVEKTQTSCVWIKDSKLSEWESERKRGLYVTERALSLLPQLILCYDVTVWYHNEDLVLITDWLSALNPENILAKYKKNTVYKQKAGLKSIPKY